MGNLALVGCVFSGWRKAYPARCRNAVGRRSRGKGGAMLFWSLNDRKSETALKRVPVSKEIGHDAEGPGFRSTSFRERRIEAVLWFPRFACEIQLILNRDSTLWRRNECINHKTCRSMRLLPVLRGAVAPLGSPWCSPGCAEAAKAGQWGSAWALR
jgi:hypothetical protein